MGSTTATFFILNVEFTYLANSKYCDTEDINNMLNDILFSFHCTWLKFKKSFNSAESKYSLYNWKYDWKK